VKSGLHTLTVVIGCRAAHASHAQSAPARCQSMPCGLAGRGWPECRR
jgi:hypothetical protein